MKKRSVKNYLPLLIFLVIMALLVFIPASGPLEFINTILQGLENIFTSTLLSDPRAQVGLVRFLLFIVCSIMFGTAVGKVDAFKNLKDEAKYPLAIILGFIAAIGLPEAAVLAVASAYSTIFFTIITLGVAVWAAYQAFEKFKGSFWKNLVGLIILIATTIFLHLIYAVMSNATFGSNTLPALVIAIKWTIIIFYGLVIWKLLSMLGLSKIEEDKKNERKKEEEEENDGKKRLPLICVIGQEANKQNRDQNNPPPYSEHALFSIKEWDDENNYPVKIPEKFNIVIRALKEDRTPIDKPDLNALNCIMRIRGKGVLGSADKIIHVNETARNNNEFKRKECLKIREIDCSAVETYIKNNMEQGRYFIHIGLINKNDYYDSALVIVNSKGIKPTEPGTKPTKLKAPIVVLMDNKKAILESSSSHKNTKNIVFITKKADYRTNIDLYEPVPEKLYLGMFIARNHSHEGFHFENYEWRALKKGDNISSKYNNLSNHPIDTKDLAINPKGYRLQALDLAKLLTYNKILNGTIEAYAVLVKEEALNHSAEFRKQIKLMITNPTGLRNEIISNLKNPNYVRTIYDFDSIKIDPEKFLAQDNKNYLKIYHTARKELKVDKNSELKSMYWLTEDKISHIRYLQSKHKLITKCINHDYEILDPTKQTNIKPYYDTINKFLENVKKHGKIRYKDFENWADIHNNLISGLSKTELENLNRFLYGGDKGNFKMIGPHQVYSFILKLTE